MDPGRSTEVGVGGGVAALGVAVVAGGGWGEAAGEQGSFSDLQMSDVGKLADEVRSAIRIQAAVRGRRVRIALAAPQRRGDPTPAGPEDRFADKVRSAIKIQAVVRGRRVRKALETPAIPAPMEDSRAGEVASEVRIQASFRGLHARKALAIHRLEGRLQSVGVRETALESPKRVEPPSPPLPHHTHTHPPL